MQEDQYSKRILLKKNGFAILGFTAPLFCVVWFFWANGALRHMIDATFLYVYAIYGEMEMSYTGIIKGGLIKTVTVARGSFLLWLMSLSSSVYIIFNERQKKNILVVSWAAASFLIIVAHREFFGYHYLIMFPPLSILTAYAIKQVLESRAVSGLALLRETGVIIILLTIIANMVVYTSLNYKHYTRFLKYWSGQKSSQWYYNQFNAFPEHEYSFASDYLVSEFLKANANREDMLFVMGGIESVIHILTGLKSPSRFVYSWFLFTTERSETKIAAKYRNELLNDLVNKKPKYILLVGPLNSYSKFNQIYEFVEYNYQLAKTFPDERYLFILKT